VDGTANCKGRENKAVEMGEKPRKEGRKRGQSAVASNVRDLNTISHSRHNDAK
jgi:hypothetical protein